MQDYSIYFKGNETLLNELEMLHSKKKRLKQLIDSTSYKSPFVVELSGLPRTGKSISVDRIYSFFKQGSIKIQKTEEPAFLIKTSMDLDKIKTMSNLEFNDKTLEVSRLNLSKAKDDNPDIILMDRGIIDNYFWYRMLYNEGKIDIQTYEQRLLSLIPDIAEIDKLIILKAEPEVIIFRDYINQLYLEPRTKTTLVRVKELNRGFEQLLPIIKRNMEESKIIEFDTSKTNEMNTAISLANVIMDGMDSKLRK